MADHSSLLSHPLERCVETITSALDDVTPIDPAFLPAATKAEMLLALSTQTERIAGLRLAVLASADDVAEDDGARSAGAWWASRHRADSAAGRRDQNLAEALDQRYAVLRVGLRSGGVNLAQARVITQALDALPENLDPETAARAEQVLLGYAGDYRPKQLKRLGARILEVVAPQVAEEHERQQLEHEEAAARVRTQIRVRSLGGGMKRAIVDISEAAMSTVVDDAARLHHTPPRPPHQREPLG